MTKEMLLELGLDEATAAKVATASEEEFKGYIEKSKYDEAITAKNELTNQLKERDKDIGELKKSAGDNAELTKRYDELQEKYKGDTDKLNSKISEIAIFLFLGQKMFLKHLKSLEKRGILRMIPNGKN